jgi:hypothetical protein
MQKKGSKPGTKGAFSYAPGQLTTGSGTNDKMGTSGSAKTK